MGKLQHHAGSSTWCASDQAPDFVKYRSVLEAETPDNAVDFPETLDRLISSPQSSQNTA